jgi:uncharacterized membrane protein (DUF485 family)
MNLTNKMLAIEEEFNFFKAKTERKYVFFLLLYFTPPLLTFFFTAKYYTDLSENMVFKAVIFGFMLLGLAFHFVLRNTYYRSNRKYKDFIEEKFKSIKTSYADEEEFRQSIVGSAHEIFSLKKGKVLSNEYIKKDIFWNNVFILIGLEIDTED